ncbi:undecaprenyl-diphosphate phosphatase [Niameybacter massiliensis]|uniref:Undecaprenyl-diphosphatase n=1 Tax=Holtiella tumoricola TaxID=3018743 RepID=A0AA42DLN7_9FIRM|nr:MULTISPECIES: undecaprenyl-diphosphate phosphatase [Lachnospirales]MDA3731051.1 undecaprenyl-diphosphate phosphatase [Holtiella tumoricola]
MDFLMMLKAGILGIVEGLTEFLPVSSTGHLIIFSNLIDFYKHSDKAFVDLFNMIIQLGAILAVVVYYWKKIWSTVTHLFPSSKTPLAESGLYFWGMILISCIPAAAIGLPFDDMVQQYLFNPPVVACTLFFGALWMIYAEGKFKGNTITPLSATPVTPGKALCVGLFQVLSIIPGMSRSASTIIGGWACGMSTVAAAEYSFFLAIPVMVGQALLHFIKLLKMPTPLNASQWGALGVGFIVSFIVALLVIDAFLSFLKKKPMRYFAFYRIIFAFVVLIAGLFGLLAI